MNLPFPQNRVLNFPKTVSRKHSRWLAILLVVVVASALGGQGREDKSSNSMIPGIGVTQVRKTISSDVLFDPSPNEGYFQGWNMGYQDSKIRIFSTLLVSNLGPNSWNNGVSVVLYLPGKPAIFLTQEWGEKDWVAKSDSLDLQSGKNKLWQIGSVLFVHFEWEDFLLDLQYQVPLAGGVSLTGGKLPLGEKDKYLRADVPFSFAKVTGSLYIQGETFPLDGVGGLEHLNTNLEVYKYSRYWEISRFQLPTGERLLLGGFVGNANYANGSYRQFALLGKGGEIQKGGSILQWEILKTEFNSLSGENLPSLQRYISADCTIEIESTKSIAEVNILSNISAVLRFFIRVFFAKPYMIHKESTLSLNCSPDSSKGKSRPKETKWKGIHSYYLINH